MAGCRGMADAEYMALDGLGGRPADMTGHGGDGMADMADHFYYAK